MSLWRLWWLTILAPALLAGAIDYLRHRVVPQYLYRWSDQVNFMAVVLLGSVVLTLIVSAYVQRHRARLLNTARDLASLWELARGDLGGAVEPQAVVQRVLPQIVSWLEMGGGAVLVAEDGRETLLGAQGLSASEVERLTEGLGRNEEAGYVWRRDVGGFAHATIVPLPATANRQGSLLLTTDRKPSIYARDRDVLTLVGQQLGGLVENARLNQRVQQLAVLEERDRLSREIHDSLAQELGYLNVKLEAAKAMKPPPSLSVELNEMLEVVRGAYMDVREWVGDLREFRMEEPGLVAFLERAVETFSRRTGIAASLEVRNGTSPSFSPEVEVQLIRVIQEALANVGKHSKSSQALVTLEQNGTTARVTVEDKGVGFVAAQAFQEGHYGLQTMRERVEGVGGALKISSHPGMGCRVEILLPARGTEVRLGTGSD